MYIFSNLATSLDGKIATGGRAFFALGTKKDLARMDVLRRRCDAVIMGAETLRTFKKPLRVQGRPGGKQPLNVILSSRLDGISPDWPFFKDPGVSRIVFVGEGVPGSRIRRFEKTCQVIVLKKAQRVQQILRALKRAGVSRLLVEGGGGLMWEFASRNLIDEYNVTLTPRILGGTEAPTLVDGQGFEVDQVVNLRLVSARKVKDEIYLVYKKTARRGR